MDFEGKVVLITGASSGIGAATAKYFAKRRADLSLAGRNEVALRDVAMNCHRLSGLTPLLTIGDVAEEKHIEELIQGTVARFGRLDVLVNNAGVLVLGTVEDPKVLSKYDRAFGVNVRPLVQATSLAAPHLAKTNGCIVNVSSLAGMRPIGGCLAYAMTKSTVDHLTRCTAVELAPKQVRVNAVNPGSILTQIQKSVGIEGQAMEDYIERTKTAHPLGRAGTSDEVASVIGFLASSAASFVTGVTIPIDGGRHCMTPASL